METHSIGPKILIILLPVLLIAGAVAAVIGFGGGEWLTASSLFNQAPIKSVEQNEVVPVTGSGASFDVQTLDEPSQDSGYGCHHDSAMSPSDY